MKYLSIISLAASFFLLPKASYAITQGSYITAEALKTHVRYYERFYNNTRPSGTRSRPSHSGSDNYGGGIAYKYAFNYRGLFFAPGIFFEKHQARADGKVSTSNLDWQRMEIENRYGVKSDIGFDIGLFAPYITGGYAAIDYRARNYSKNSIYSGAYHNGTVKDFFYGAGFKIEIPRSYVSLNFEYNTNNFFAKTSISPEPAATAGGYRGEYRTRLDIFKLGLSFNF